MFRKILSGKESRRKLSIGVDAVANAVKVTLGPRGRNVVITRLKGVPHVTKDGVSVAREINLVDVEADAGAQMVKQAAIKTVVQAGDGTTTATVLAQAMVSAGMVHVNSGSNPVDLKKGMDKAVSIVVDFIKKVSHQIRHDSVEIENVATISANNDPEIGKLIAEAMSKVGVDGSISAKESITTETTVEVVEGMQVSKGYVTPYFVTDDHKMVTEYNDVLVLIYDKAITHVKDVVAAADAALNAGKSLIIFAESIGGEALKALVANKREKGYRFVAVNAPGVGLYKKDILEDIAAVTNGKLITGDAGMLLGSFDKSEIMEFLGHAERVVVDRSSTIIINNNADQKGKITRVNQIKAQIEESKTEDDKTQLKDRLAKITGGVGVINVGAATNVELIEKKDRIDDALSATRAAVEEGIVPGGGLIYIRAMEALNKAIPGSTNKKRGWIKTLFLGPAKENDEVIGMRIVAEALRSPAVQILENSGLPSEDIIDKILGGSINYGYNSKTEKYENLIQTGVIDPAKVSRVALENAASVSGMILTTEVVLGLETEENQ